MSGQIITKTLVDRLEVGAPDYTVWGDVRKQVAETFNEALCSGRTDSPDNRRKEVSYRLRHMTANDGIVRHVVVCGARTNACAAPQRRRQPSSRAQRYTAALGYPPHGRSTSAMA